MNSVRDNLIAARKLIEARDRWAANSFEAHQFGKMCALQAIEAASDNKNYSRVKEGFQGQTGGFSIPHFNDTHTHAEVLAAFDRAISESQ